MSVRTVNSVLDHLANLARQFFALEVTVPKPERPDAVFPVGIQELVKERSELAGKQAYHPESIRRC